MDDLGDRIPTGVLLVILGLSIVGFAMATIWQING